MKATHKRNLLCWWFVTNICLSLGLATERNFQSALFASFGCLIPMILTNHTLNSNLNKKHFVAHSFLAIAHIYPTTTCYVYAMIQMSCSNTSLILQRRTTPPQNKLASAQMLFVLSLTLLLLIGKSQIRAACPSSPHFLHFDTLFVFLATTLVLVEPLSR
jgi:hypothetical protein